MVSEDALAQRIMRDLDSIFSDVSVSSFEVCIANGARNKCPVIRHGEHIGLEMWCVKYLFAYAYRRMMDLRRQRRPKTDMAEVTRTLLLLKPETTVAWNIRKEMLKSGQIGSTDELKLSEIILTSKSKSPDNFAHRRWILGHRTEMTLDDIENELRVTLDAASRYARNYGAWSHRTWAMEQLKHSTGDDERIRHSELEMTRGWMMQHVSDYSVYAYRQYLFMKELDTKPDRHLHVHLRNLIEQEYETLRDLFELHPDQEALFLHRRFLLGVSLKIDLTELEVLQIEKDFIRMGFSDSAASEWKLQLMKRHEMWLKRFMKVSY